MVPKVGDTIRTAKPMNCDSPLHRAGQHIHLTLTTPEAVEEARRLIASGRWVLVPKQQTERNV